MNISHEPSDAQLDYAEHVGWAVDAASADQQPRPELTGHLFADDEHTLCGLRVLITTTAPATADDVPCRQCVEVVDPVASAALVDDEVPFGLPGR